jgi:antitoxin CcdA
MMLPLVNAPKKATNITLSSDVLAEAKALGINISQSCDQFLRELVRMERERRWQQDSADFIAAYNQTVLTPTFEIEGIERKFYARQKKHCN